MDGFKNKLLYQLPSVYKCYWVFIYNVYVMITLNVDSFLQMKNISEEWLARECPAESRNFEGTTVVPSKFLLSMHMSADICTAVIKTTLKQCLSFFLAIYIISLKGITAGQ